MPKRKRSDLTPEHIDLVFEQIYTAVRMMDFAFPGAALVAPQLIPYLGRLKPHIVSNVTKGEEQMAATAFTLDNAVKKFGLNYTTERTRSAERIWKIEDLVNLNDVEATPCIGKVLLNCANDS